MPLPTPSLPEDNARHFDPAPRELVGGAVPLVPPAFPTVAALYVETNGCYFGLTGVDPWDEARDARQYGGPHPVVAHPPCQRWGKLWAGQPLWIKRTGQRKVKGDDGGCFAAALAAVRQFGGVIEHPEQSHAWAHFGLNKPPRHGGWVAADYLGAGRYGWTCCVEQGQYGHHARKPTWLYAVDTDRPELRWGKSEMRLDPEIVDRIGLDRAKRRGEVASKGGGVDSPSRIGTPPEFRDLLLSIARSARAPVAPFIPDEAEMHFDRWPYWEAFSRPSFEDWQFDILLTLHQGDDTIGLTCSDRIDDAPGGIPDGYLLPGAVGSFLHPLGISAEAQPHHVAR